MKYIVLLFGDWKLGWSTYTINLIAHIRKYIGLHKGIESLLNSTIRIKEALLPGKNKIKICYLTKFAF